MTPTSDRHRYYGRSSRYGTYLDPIHRIHSVHLDSETGEGPPSGRSPLTSPLTRDNTPTVNGVNTVNGEQEGDE